MRRTPALQSAINQLENLTDQQGMARVTRSAKRALRKLEDVMDSLEKRRATFLTIARKVAIEIAMANPERIVTVDDVRRICPPIGNMDPRVMGGIFANKNLFEPVGFISSTRRDCHGRPIRQFRLITH